MVVTGAYELMVGELKTGKVHQYLPYSDLKWGQRLNEGGPISASLRPGSKQLRLADLPSLTTPVKQFMAVVYKGEILEAGPIWTAPYNEKTQTLQINGLGLWSIFDRRKNIHGSYLLPGAEPTKAKKVVSARHPGSVARELVRMSIQDNPYGGELPVVLPAFQSGVAARTYWGYNLTWLGDDLRELTKAEDGADLRFRPRFKGNDQTYVEWVLEHGAEDVLQQSGPDWRWDANIERSGIAELGVERTGTGLGSFAWTPGSGQEQAMKLAVARSTELVDAGYPWTEVEDSSSSEEDQSVLQSLSNRQLADASRPWDSWSLTVRADRDPVLGNYFPGDWAVVNVPQNHPVMQAGSPVRVRIMAVDGNSSNDVTLSVAPIQGTASDAPGQIITNALLPYPELLPSLDLFPHI